MSKNKLSLKGVIWGSDEFYRIIKQAEETKKSKSNAKQDYCSINVPPEIISEMIINGGANDE